jgi:hypothetical protein
MTQFQKKLEVQVLSLKAKKSPRSIQGLGIVLSKPKVIFRKKYKDFQQTKLLMNNLNQKEHFFSVDLTIKKFFSVYSKVYLSIKGRESLKINRILQIL